MKSYMIVVNTHMPCIHFSPLRRTDFSDRKNSHGFKPYDHCHVCAAWISNRDSVDKDLHGFNQHYKKYSLGKLQLIKEELC